MKKLFSLLCMCVMLFIYSANGATVTNSIVNYNGTSFTPPVAAAALTNFVQKVVTKPSTLTYDGTNVVVNATNGNVFTLTANCNFYLGIGAGYEDQIITLRIVQDATGGRTCTMTNMFHFGSDITGITLSSTAGAVDYIRCQYFAPSNRWDVIGFVRGY